MQQAKDTMIAWLRDAHAMEQATVDNQERLVSHLEHYPEIRSRFEQHMQESRMRADKLERHLKDLGADTSTFKEMTTKFASMAQQTITGGSSDEIVKQVVAAAAFEEFELANFKALATAAELNNEPAIKATCDEAVRDQEEMVSWLSQQIPPITREYLLRNEQGRGDAKH
ncbi:DUF892 family protein [Telmatospirillum sp. J64-1]|uniref:DUF892 family protein n=1 Tax=Telmatospirillum sp. J64-1 TaxID=2502183 RepID=UPI00115C9B37|nr:DUF892 family protein [Telmatospirillum sp. J64-1]